MYTHHISSGILWTAFFGGLVQGEFYQTHSMFLLCAGSCLAFLLRTQFHSSWSHKETRISRQPQENLIMYIGCTSVLVPVCSFSFPPSFLCVNAKELRMMYIRRDPMCPAGCRWAWLSALPAPPDLMTCQLNLM